MPRTCFFCGKGVDFGHTISHAHNVGPRRWNPNLQTVRAVVDGKTMRISVCTRCIRAGKVQKAK
ncbi:MAG: 50S ribosomal protein L28 [Candidatus Edwardsbacteria bacterium]|nr:50S ribosomal protein L28 [Candidatus Edwardsbacteria bacterium]